MAVWQCTGSKARYGEVSTHNNADDSFPLGVVPSCLVCPCKKRQQYETQAATNQVPNCTNLFPFRAHRWPWVSHYLYRTKVTLGTNFISSTLAFLCFPLSTPNEKPTKRLTDQKYAGSRDEKPVRSSLASTLNCDHFLLLFSKSRIWPPAAHYDCIGGCG
jgi:hypothetical protein